MRYPRGATLVILAVLVASCASGTTADAPPVDQVAQPLPDPITVEPVLPPVDVDRTEGSVAVQATTAPEWQANGGVRIAADAEGTLRFAQILTAERAFDLQVIELESRGLIGADRLFVYDVVVTVHHLPDGPFPQRFDVGQLPAVGQGVSSVLLEPIDTLGPGTMSRLTLAEPIEVPDGRLLVALELRADDAGSVRGLDLSGRRGAIGGSGECSDHNPDGAFLLAAAEGAGGAQVLQVPGPEVQTQPCSGPSGPAAFHMTMRLEGPPLTTAAAEELREALPVIPAIPAIEELAPPQPVPSGPAAPSAPAGPAPARAIIDTAPATVQGDWARFYWNPRFLREIGQTVRVEQPFTLEAVEMRIDALTRLDLSTISEQQWLDLPSDEQGRYEVWHPQATGVRLRVTLNIWRVLSEGDPGTRIDATSGLDLVDAQAFDLRVDISSGPGGRDTRMTLARPLRLDPGRYLVSFHLQTDDPTILTVHVLGWQSGNNTRTGPRQQGPESPCQYTRLPDIYPEGRAYIRNTEPFFIEHDAKVSECIQVGSYDDIFNPGDIRVRLLGDRIP